MPDVVRLTSAMWEMEIEIIAMVLLLTEILCLLAQMVVEVKAS